MKLVAMRVVTIFALGTASITAQGRGNGQAKKTTSPKPAKTEARAVKTQARAAKAETRAAKAETRAARAETKAARTQTKAAKTNANQEAQVLAKLPPGTNIQDASLGFKNRGQFIAAVNASKNHNIPFDELKARMTGIPVGSTVPATAPMSLGQALQSFNVTTTTTTTPQP